MVRFFLCAAAAVAASTVSASCNPERLARDVSVSQDVAATVGVTSGLTGKLRFLPHDLSNPESAACLDGSPYGFYFVPSTKNSTKWTISINGGGWCYDEVDCYCRSKTQLGTSTVLAPESTCGCMNPNEDGTIDTDCNCIHLPYSDGASFSGYRAEAWPVPEDHDAGVPANATVYFRGIKNFDGILDFAVANGMADASELVVTGGSAGGLSTFLHTDRAAARVHESTKVRAAPVVGFFLDHDNFLHTDGNASGHGGPNTPEWSTPGTGANYTAWMKYIYTMQNLTFGAAPAASGLTEACDKLHPTEPHLCFMSPHMAEVIETPLFMFNSRFDAWQLANEFQSKWTTKDEQDGVVQYGADFLTQLEPLWNSTINKHGGFITTCICHGCPWTDLQLQNKTSYQHYADWFYEKVTGPDAMHIDYRAPNGGGFITFKECEGFPKTAGLSKPTLPVVDAFLPPKVIAD